MKIETILTPVDGSDHSMTAAKYAVDLAKMVNAKIVLLHCHKRFPVVLAEPNYSKAINLIFKESDKLIAPFVKVLEDTQVEFETKILEGPAGKVIPKIAEFEKADLIVMGSRGCSDLEGLILGSIAHKVLQLASCPVLVLK